MPQFRCVIKVDGQAIEEIVESTDQDSAWNVCMVEVNNLNGTLMSVSDHKPDLISAVAKIASAANLTPTEAIELNLGLGGPYPLEYY